MGFLAGRVGSPIRIEGFGLSLSSDPFGRDLSYLVKLVAERKLDPQLAGELSLRRYPRGDSRSVYRATTRGI